MFLRRIIFDWQEEYFPEKQDKNDIKKYQQFSQASRALKYVEIKRNKNEILRNIREAKVKNTRWGSYPSSVGVNSAETIERETERDETPVTAVQPDRITGSAWRSDASHISQLLSYNLVSLRVQISSKAASCFKHQTLNIWYCHWRVLRKLLLGIYSIWTPNVS